MQSTSELEDFVKRPLGRALIDDAFVVWCAAPDLSGSLHWGALDLPTMRRALAAWAHIRHPGLAARTHMLMDFAELERVDAAAALELVGAAPFADVAARAGGTTRSARHVVVLPGGVAGMLLAGAMPSIGMRHAIEFARDRARGLALIGHADAARAAAEAAAIAAEARGPALLVARLRAQIGRDLVEASLARCADALDLSTRTLQRALAAQGTTFRDELRRVRAAACEELLVHSDLKIEAIAARVGFRSSSHMNLVLRRERGATAGELRLRGRGPASS